MRSWPKNESKARYESVRKDDKTIFDVDGDLAL